MARPATGSGPDRRQGRGPTGDGVGARPATRSGPDRRRGRGPTADGVGARPPTGSGPDRRRSWGPTTGPEQLNLHKRKAATHKRIRSSTLTKSSSPTKQPSDSPVKNQAAQKRAAATQQTRSPAKTSHLQKRQETRTAREQETKEHDCVSCFLMSFAATCVGYISAPGRKGNCACCRAPTPPAVGPRPPQQSGPDPASRPFPEAGCSE